MTESFLPGFLKKPGKNFFKVARFFEKKRGKKLSGISFTSAYSVAYIYAIGV